MVVIVVVVGGVTVVKQIGKVDMAVMVVPHINHVSPHMNVILHLCE